MQTPQRRQKITHECLSLSFSLSIFLYLSFICAVFLFLLFALNISISSSLYLLFICSNSTLLIFTHSLFLPLSFCFSVYLFISLYLVLVFTHIISQSFFIFFHKFLSKGLGPSHGGDCVNKFKSCNIKTIFFMNGLIFFTSYLYYGYLGLLRPRQYGSI